MTPDLKRDHDRRNAEMVASMAREILAAGDLYSAEDRRFAHEVLQRAEGGPEC